MGAAGVMMGFAGAAIGAGASMVGNGMSHASQQAANAANKEIAQMNNEFNEKMLEKQMAYNRDERLAAQGFNSAEAQKARDFSQSIFDQQKEYNSLQNRFKQAQDVGLNPYATLSGASFGSAGSVGSTSASSSPASVGAASAAGAAPMQGTRFDFSGIGSSIASAMEMYDKYTRNKADIRQLQLNYQLESRKAMAQIANAYANARNQDAKTKSLNTLRDLEAANLMASTDQRIQETENLKMTMKGIIIQNQMDELRLKSLPDQLSLQIASASASVALMRAQGALTERQAERELSQKILTDAQAQGLKISNKYADDLAAAQLNQAISILRRMENNEGPDSILKLYYSGKERGSRPWFGHSDSSGNYVPGILF